MFFRLKNWIIFVLVVLLTATSFYFSGFAEALELQNEPLVVRNSDGDRTGFIGIRAALRLGTDGETGRIFLFPSDATDIFNENQSAIRMNANGSSMTLRGENSFIFLDGDDRGRSELTVRNGTIFLQGENGFSSITTNSNGGICIGNC